jgi:hypothetical protein
MTGKERTMSQIRSFDDALDFYPEGKLGARARFGGYLHKAATYWDAVVEGLAASRHYHALRARGLSHDQAATRVFAAHYN